MADQSTAQNAEESKKETHDDKTINEVLKLDALPNEIISLITHALSIGIHVPYVPFGEHHQTEEGRKEEDVDARRDLTRLCMVSKKVFFSARKALYRNILIADADTLIFLYRTLLERPELGIYVKRLTLNIDYGVEMLVIRRRRSFQSEPIDLGPLLSCAQHGLGEHLTAAVSGSNHAPYQIILETLYTLQLKVLARTSSLVTLDLNVHPHLNDRDTYEDFSMDDRHLEVISGVLSSLWQETSARLKGLKNLQMIGKEIPAYCPGARSGFVALICRCFLALPKLERLTWLNHADGWFDTFPCRLVSGKHCNVFYLAGQNLDLIPTTLPHFTDVPYPQILGPGEHMRADTELRYESMRTLELVESSCFPRDLVSLCSAFPNLESLSVDTTSDQCRVRLRPETLPPQLHGNADPNSGMRAEYLTDSFASLKDLRTLNLDLHWAYNISRTLGPSGILSLAGLSSLQALAVPFHFFLKKDPDGHYKVVSPVSILPRALKSLRIVACYDCLEFWICEELRSSFSMSQYRATVLEFLDEVANFKAGSFPSLTKVCYNESARWGARCICSHCPFPDQYDHLEDQLCPFHFVSESDKSRLKAVSLTLHQAGVEFERLSSMFLCVVYTEQF